MEINRKCQTVKDIQNIVAMLKRKLLEYAYSRIFNQIHYRSFISHHSKKNNQLNESIFMNRFKDMHEVSRDQFV